MGAREDTWAVPGTPKLVNVGSIGPYEAKLADLRGVCPGYPSAGFGYL